MKPTLTIALLASTALALATTSPRSLRAQQTNPPPSTAPYAGSDELKPPKQPSPFAKGTILQIDLRSQSFALQTPDGARTFVWTSRTYVYRGKEKLSVEKLQAGDHIKLSFSTNERGQAEVKRIKVDITDPASQTNRQADLPR